MNSFVLVVVLVVLTSTGIEAKRSDQDDRPEVSSPAGTFRGTTLTSLRGHPYTAFLGIPYALPPVLGRRFKKPQRYPTMEDTYDADEIPPVCIQMAGIDLHVRSQEDCLYLNVFVPHGSLKDIQKKQDKAQLKKVFVYIHGGGYYMGSGHIQVPGDLVAMGDVIVVNFNYRLYWLGFLKGDTPELPGNLGLRDQIMALNWVKDNIRSFGGDPDDITVGGNSMGSQSISALSITPYGKGLFTKALLSSSTMFLSKATFGSSDFLLDKFAEVSGCKDGPSDTKDTETLVKCVRALPQEAFSTPFYFPAHGAFYSVDGDIFPRSISELIADKEYLASVGFYNRDYIVSTTSNEGVLFFEGIFRLGVDPEDFTAEFFSATRNIPVPVCEKVLEWYSMPGHFSTKPAYDIMGDLVINLPNFLFLETSSGGPKDNSIGKLGKSYALFWNFTPAYNPPSYEGIFHGLDLIYIFDFIPSEVLPLVYYLSSSTQGMTEDDLAIKDLYIKVLTDLMKHGDPGLTLAKETDVKWPTFDRDSEYYLSMEPSPVIRQFPMKERRDFWKEEVPKYMAKYSDLKSKEEL